MMPMSCVVFFRLSFETLGDKRDPIWKWSEGRPGTPAASSPRPSLPASIMRFGSCFPT